MYKHACKERDFECKVGTESKDRAFSSEDKDESGDEFRYGGSHGVWVGDFIHSSNRISSGCHPNKYFLLSFDPLGYHYQLRETWVIRIQLKALTQDSLKLQNETDNGNFENFFLR